MGIYDINNNPHMVRVWLDNEKSAEKQYLKDNKGSLIPSFEKELRSLGYKFETANQALGLVPKHKNEIVPVAIKYYRIAKTLEITNEQDYFLGFFRINGLSDVVPMLLEDYSFEKTANITRWFISDCIYQIRSSKYLEEYLAIVTNKRYGINRQMIILLLGKLKEENAIPVLIELLEDEEVRLQAISALGEFKREEFRPYFERFYNSTHPGWRKYAKIAIKKLDAGILRS